MYEQVFNLTSRPFTSTHYVKHYFPAKEIDQTLQQSKMLIERGSGPVIVVGDHGTGKTLLLAILEETFKAQFRIVNISATLLRSREDLLQNILFQLQMNCRGLGENEMRLDLIEMLKNEQSGGILLMIDDAQKLTSESIEEMQLLTNFIHDGEPRVRLVLTGSQGLEERLADTRLISFNQRIAGRFFLSCLSRDEVEAYVRAHLERAGGQPDNLFSPDSYRAIHEVSEGRPRYINQVCDHAMIFSATRGTVPVTDSLVREAWYDIQKLPGSVAPSGSGAGMSEAPLVSQNIETDSEGWTVLEFGELSDSEAEDMDAPVVQETPAPAPAPAPVQEIPAAAQEELPAEETFINPPILEQPTAAEPETVQEVLPPTTAQPIPGPSFSVAPSGEVQATPVQAEPPVETVEQVQTESDMAAPTALGGAAILASAMAGFGVNAENESETSNFQQEAPPAEPQSTVEDAFEVEPQMLTETLQDAEPVEPHYVASEPQVVAEPQQPEPSINAVEAQPVAPTYTESAAPAVEQQAAPNPAVFEDPFAGDEYENEEVLADAYSPFVAQQNQRSLDVTTDQLQNLTPGDVVQSNETPEPQVESNVVEEESFPTFETAMEPAEPVREVQRPVRDPRETAETRVESGGLGPNSLSDEFQVNREAALFGNGEVSPSADVASVDLDPVEANPGSGFVPLAPTPMVEGATEQPSTPQLPPQYAAPVPAPSQPAFETPVETPAPAVETPSPVAASPTPPVAIPQPPVAAPTSIETPPEPTSVDVPHLVDSAPLEPQFTSQPPAFTEQTITEQVPVVPVAPQPPVASQPPAPQQPPAVPQQPIVQQPTVVQQPVPEPVVQPEPVASLPETFLQQSVQIASPSVPVPEPDASFHEQASSPDDPEIRRQAADIIRSLSMDSGSNEVQVSHETEPEPEPTPVQEEVNAIEATIQRSIESRPAPEPIEAAPVTSAVVMPDLGQIQDALRQAQSGQGYSPAESEPPVPLQEATPMMTLTPSPSPTPAPTPPGRIPVQIAGVDPVKTEQEILQEVKEQAAMFAGSIASQDANEPTATQDDRDILEVNQNQVANEQAAAQTEEAPMPAWSQQEPSQGEASRLDYQRLFDQLRNVQGNQE